MKTLTPSQALQRRHLARLMFGLPMLGLASLAGAASQALPFAPPPDGPPPDGPPPDGPPPGPPPMDGEEGGPKAAGDGPPNGPQGGPPDGPPPGAPDGPPPGGPGEVPPPGGGPRARPYTLAGQLDVGDDRKPVMEGLKLSETRDDMSVVYAHGASARLTLRAAQLSSAGHASDFDNASFHGLNAVVLADAGAQLQLEGGRVESSGRGANGLFAAGKGSRIRVRQMQVRASGDNAHALMCTKGGELIGEALDLETVSQRSAPIATDRGGGLVRIKGGRALSKGRMSPGIYSTGQIELSEMDVQALDAEAAVVEGSNGVLLRACKLQGARNGVMVYQSFSGDAQGQRGRFEMQGGMLAASAGAAFYITNTRAEITLEGVDILCASGLLLEARADRWGRKGGNGGHARLLARGQQLSGLLRCEAGSTALLQLRQRSRLRGSTEGAVSLQIEAGSQWVLTGDCRIAGLTLDGDAKALAEAIDSRGHELRYDASHAANAWLAGRQLALTGGGVLRPL